MKKYLILIAIFLVLSVILYFFGSLDWLVPKSVRTVRGDRIVDLQKRADESAARFKGNLESGQKAGSEYQKLGIEHIRRQEWTPAIEALKKAIEFGQNQPGVHHSVAVAYANRGRQLGSENDLDMAENHYNLAIKGNPSMWDSHYGIAILKYFAKNQKDEGIRIVRDIIRGEPQYFPARFALARFLYEEGKPSEALAVYEETYSLLKSAPDIAENREFKIRVKENISRIMTEISR